MYVIVKLNQETSIILKLDIRLSREINSVNRFNLLFYKVIFIIKILSCIFSLKTNRPTIQNFVQVCCAFK